MKGYDPEMTLKIKPETGSDLIENQIWAIPNPTHHFLLSHIELSKLLKSLNKRNISFSYNFNH